MLQFLDSDLQLSGLPLDFFGLFVQIYKHRDFGEQYLRHDWFHQVIHSPNLVTPENVRIAGVDSSEENDRGILRTRTPTDEFSRLKAINIRHLNIKQDHRKVLMQQTFQRLLT